MDLKGRLKLIAQKVPECDRVCDIGTDHAYIPIYLIQNHVCKKAIAADVGQGPLSAAEENIRSHKLEDRIETRLGDGLEPIAEDEADVIVIAGMGGILIKDILERDIAKAKKAKGLVLQPMNALEVTREWLYVHGFEILDEELTNEGEKIYNVIVCKWTGKRNKVEKINYYIGKKLIERRDPLLPVYLEKKLRQVKGVLKEMENTRDHHTVETKMEYEYLAENYAKILEEINL